MSKESFPHSHLVILILLIILFVITVSLYYFKPVQVNDLVSEDMVVRVIDGDTFELYNGDKVRLICVDTPELGDAGSYESKEFLEGLILGEEVRMEMDVSETDKYGRLLRYVWVNVLGDEVFVNKAIVKGGYGVVFE